MTTPRFPNDFWHNRRPDPEHRDHLWPVTGALPHVDRLQAFPKVFDAALFTDEADPELLRELEAEDRIDPLHADGPWRVVSDWAPGLGRRPQSLFIPEHYEPKYAYPLLVWLTEDDRPGQLAEVMPDISTRNFFGLAFPVPSMPHGGEEPAPQGVLDALKAAVLEVRRRFHIHSERIYLAGIDAGAAWALDLVLQKPEWFGGAVVLSGRVPSVRQALSDFANLQGKRVLLGSQKGANNGSVDALQQTGKLLHSAGLNVETRVFDTDAQSPQRMLSDVNRWIMEGLCSPV